MRGTKFGPMMKFVPGLPARHEPRSLGQNVLRYCPSSHTILSKGGLHRESVMETTVVLSKVQEVFQGQAGCSFLVVDTTFLVQ